MRLGSIFVMCSTSSVNTQAILGRPEAILQVLSARLGAPQVASLAIRCLDSATRRWRDWRELPLS